MKVAAHAFDILARRPCGFKAAYVNRYNLPTEDSEYQPNIIVNDFVELAGGYWGDEARISLWGSLRLDPETAAIEKTRRIISPGAGTMDGSGDRLLGRGKLLAGAGAFDLPGRRY